MDNTYGKLTKKLEALRKIQIHKTSTHTKQHTFHERTMNLTQTEIDQEEINLINVGTDYAIERPISHNIKELITQTEQAISQLDEHLRNGYRIQKTQTNSAQL